MVYAGFTVSEDKMAVPSENRYGASRWDVIYSRGYAEFAEFVRDNKDRILKIVVDDIRGCVRVEYSLSEGPFFYLDHETNSMEIRPDIQVESREFMSSLFETGSRVSRDSRSNSAIVEVVSELMENFSSDFYCRGVNDSTAENDGVPATFIRFYRRKNTF